MTQRYLFIKTEKVNYAILTLCRVMQVSRSGFYDWQCRATSKRVYINAMLLVQFKRIFEKNHKRYGFRRVLRVLLAEGYQAGKHRVARLMRENGLVARRRRTFYKTTDAKHTYCIAHNKLNREFTAEAVNQALSHMSKRPRVGSIWRFL